MRMIKFGVVALALVSIAAYAAGCGSGSSSGKVLVEVNGEKITEGDLDFLSEVNPRIAQQINNPEGKKRILDNLVEQNLLYQQAIKEGINRDPKVKAKADLYRKVIIAQALVDDAVEKMAKDYYEKNQDEFKKLKLSHIQINFGDEKGKKDKKAKAKGRTEEEALKLANEIKAKIDGGASFEDMAKEKSDDAMTKARGGNMGLVSKDDRRLMMRGFQPVLEKAFELKVGEVAGPIKTQSGYEIITVTQGIELEPFESAKQSILFKVRNTTRDNLLAKLKKDSKIAFKDEEGKKAATKAEDAGKPPVIKIPPEKADQAEAAAEAPATPPPAEKEKAEAKTPAAEEAKKE